MNSNIGLLLIDWQTRLFPVMPEDFRQNNLENAVHLKWLFESLSLPVLVTEQYPKGLGHTLDALQPVSAYEKTAFSAFETLNAVDPKILTKHVVISGMETHICVFQTATDLLDNGHDVSIVTDACLSRHKLDWRSALNNLCNRGAKLVSSEMLLFDLIKDAKHSLFKDLSRRIKG